MSTLHRVLMALAAVSVALTGYAILYSALPLEATPIFPYEPTLIDTPILLDLIAVLTGTIGILAGLRGEANTGIILDSISVILTVAALGVACLP